MSRKQGPHEMGMRLPAIAASRRQPDGETGTLVKEAAA
jgi:hypothetical protein